MTKMSVKIAICLILVQLLFSGGLARSTEGDPPDSRSPIQQLEVGITIDIEPDPIELEVGSTLQLTATVLDVAGQVISGRQALFFSLARTGVGVSPSGLLEAFTPGVHELLVLIPEASPRGELDSYTPNDSGIRRTISVRVPWPPIKTVEFLDPPAQLYVGTTMPLPVQVVDATGVARPDAGVTLQSSDETILVVNLFGQATALSPGRAVLVAAMGSVSTSHDVEVRSSPVVDVELISTMSEARTGDVVRFRAIPRDSGGRPVEDAHVSFALESHPDPARPESVGAGAPAQVALDGRFVAEQPGVYTVLASAGARTARRSVRIVPRAVRREIEVIGHARVGDRITSDLWVWEGVDGRDYAVHGTWNAEGHAYFYDVTDPANMRLIDTVQVDARTVNDVKVSENGRICVISREGASTRRNGIVILDVTDPNEVEILSQFDDQLTGGVHNVFVHEEHVYAVNNGRRWDVINIEDPRRPVRVGRFETETPGRSVHDVWVRDGIAYQAGRTDGLIMVDVGGGRSGGSPSNPVEMARFGQLTGWSHGAWPFQSPSTGKHYVVGGDEAFYRTPLAPESGGINWREKLPSRAKGWLHFVEFDDLDDPREVARYQVPDSGPHNYWVDWQEEVLYVGHFNAGLRVVDISGELMGDLYRQGREIARFYSDDPKGYVINAPFVWGPQPHKGTIFFADLNSGLWAVRLGPPTPE